VKEEVVQLAGMHWYVREGTTDFNTIRACCEADEYQVGSIEVEGAKIIDFGAHVGGFAVWNAKRGATVLAVEPIRENVEQIKKNARINDAGLYVFQAAVGTSKVYLGPEGDNHEYISAMAQNEGARCVEVPEVSLHVLCQFLGWVPDILKLDCEGGEWDVFNDPACQEVPLIVGEYHPSPKYPGTTAEMIASLLPNHNVFTGENEHFDPFRAEHREVDFGPCTSS
jgi:FkbM family methyltransferase